MRRLFTILLGLLLTVVPASTPLVTARGAPPPRPVAFAATRMNTRAAGGPPVRAFAPSADPAAGLTALTVTPQAGLGEQRFYTLERQRLSDRMDLAVNVANGNLVVHAHDLQVRGTGLDLVVDRYYNNLTQNAAEFGAAPWIMGTGRDVGLQPGSGGEVFFGPSGYQVLFTQNPDGSFTSPTGIDATLVHNGDGTYTLTFHKTGEKYSFSGGGVLTADTDQNGNHLAFAYNADGTLASITDTQGRATTFGYTGGKLTLMTDSAGRTYQYGYDGNGLLTTYTDPADKVTHYGYDGNDLDQITDPDGNVTKIAYDAQDRVASITRVTDPGAGTGPTTGFTYNAGNTVVTDPNSHQTTYTYDGQGRVTQTRDALGHTQGTSYTSNSDVQQRTDAAGKLTIFNYDGNNNLTSAAVPTGAMQHYGYTDAAHPFYPTSATDPQGNTLSYAYDPNGNLKTTTDGLASQNQLQATYNTNGTVATTTDADGHVTSYGYDPKGNLTGITPPAPLGGMSFTYDTLSRVKTATDGKHQTTTYTYDALDRVTGIAYADASTITYGFDDDGNLTSLVDNTGTTTFTYDPLNRQTEKALPGGETLTYGYDDVGNMTSLTDGGGEIDYAYNEVNLLTTLTEPGGAQTTFTYDANNRRLTTAFPNGVTETRTYDDSGRLASVGGKDSGGTVLTSNAYTYTNASSQDTALVQTLTDTLGNVTNYTYDALNRLTHAQRGGTYPADFQYAYDGAGNRTSQTANGDQTSYAYNGANELCWTYAGASGAACANPPGGATTYSFDADGNETGNSAGLALVYNAKNQTTSVTPPGGAAIAMTYTGATQAERVSYGDSTLVNGLLGQQALIDNDGDNRTEYVRDVNGQVLMQRTPDGTYYYLVDNLGSVLQMTDSTGAPQVTDLYQYEPYGAVIFSNTPVSNRWRFAQGYYDSAPQLYKFGQRFYDPALGRWTQQDPVVHLADPMQANRYSYVGDSPCNFTDPTGTSCSTGETVNRGIVAGIASVAAVGSILITPPIAATVVGAGYVLVDAAAVAGAFYAAGRFGSCFGP